eukprot:CAMPEP_0174905408 /NCGR_PEP_ID=MMETSP0167-20121228/52870_1 /TAXON_ID=38298 /ORGANISM="Rhodella maculata, Strain CCMP736" /LENGTH=198 /DNA_ID=CAMNT_0016148333 /DNA_START=54 /DNA_END=650 /DNA_ORIENTATION=+
MPDLSAKQVFRKMFSDHRRIVDYPPHQPFLTTENKVGSPTAPLRKLGGQLILLLASLVVFGAAADVATVQDKCNGFCGYVVGAGMLSALVLLCTLVFGALRDMKDKGEPDTDRDSFSTRRELQWMVFLFVWWVPLVTVNSMVQMPTTRTGVFAGFVALLSSLYVCFMGYIVVMESETKKLPFRYDDTQEDGLTLVQGI